MRAITHALLLWRKHCFSAYHAELTILFFQGAAGLENRRFSPSLPLVVQSYRAASRFATTLL